jgi:hypothetical protein
VTKAERKLAAAAVAPMEANVSLTPDSSTGTHPSTLAERRRVARTKGEKGKIVRTEGVLGREQLCATEKMPTGTAVKLKLQDRVVTRGDTKETLPVRRNRRHIPNSAPIYPVYPMAEAMRRTSTGEDVPAVISILTDSESRQKASAVAKKARARKVTAEQRDYDYDMAEAELEYERLAEADALEAGVYYADEINLKERESDIHDAETERAEVSLALKRLDEGTLIEGEEMSFVPAAGETFVSDQTRNEVTTDNGSVYGALLADELIKVRKLSERAESAETAEIGEKEHPFTASQRQSVATLVSVGGGKTFNKEKGLHFANLVEAASDDPDNQAPLEVIDVYKLEEHAEAVPAINTDPVVTAENLVHVDSSAVVYADRKPIPATAPENWVRRVPSDDRDTAARLALDRAESAQGIGHSHPDSATDALSAIVDLEEELSYGRPD